VKGVFNLLAKTLVADGVPAMGRSANLTKNFPLFEQTKDSGLVACTDLSGHDSTYRRVVQPCGLPDLRMGAGVPELQCGYQPVSGALIARPEFPSCRIARVR